MRCMRECLYVNVIVRCVCVCVRTFLCMYVCVGVWWGVGGCMRVSIMCGWGVWVVVGGWVWVGVGGVVGWVDACEYYVYVCTSMCRCFF